MFLSMKLPIDKFVFLSYDITICANFNPART